jgi:hypothetical protein
MSEANQPTTAASPARKRIIIGLPGSSFNHNFLLAWTRALHFLWESGRYEIVIAPGTSSFVSFARMKTLGLDVLRGKDQKPFNGKEYDVFVSIDSDIVFSPEQLVELIESTDTHPVVAGTYLMSDCKHLAVVKDWNIEHYTTSGSFEFLTPQVLEQIRTVTNTKFMPVSYVGMGFFAARKEVLDSLKYPYFHTDLQEMQAPDGTQIVEMCSEDVAFCKNIYAAGHTVYIHTGLRVGHIKELII